MRLSAPTLLLLPLVALVATLLPCNLLPRDPGSSALFPPALFPPALFPPVLFPPVLFPPVLAADEGADAKAAATPHPVVVRVTGNEVNLRSGPSIDYHAVGQASRDDLLIRVATVDEFVLARLPGGPVVYVFESLVNWEEGDLRGTVIADDVLMRATPSQAYYPVHDQKLRRGDTLIVLGAEDNRDGNGARGRWYKVIAPERIHVWIHADFVVDTTLRPDSPRVIGAAQARLDELTDGRTKTERDDVEALRREAVEARLAVIATAIEAGTASAEHVQQAREIAAVERVEALKTRAGELERSVTRLLAERESAAEDARIAKMKAEAEAAKRAQEEREAEHRKKLEEIERKRQRAGRGDPVATGIVRKRGRRIWIETEKADLLDLRSVRFRLVDYADKKVRVWGSVTKRPDVRDRIEVESIEVVTR